MHSEVVVGSISAVLFTMLVLLSSFITTFFMSWFEDPSDSYYYRSSIFGFGGFGFFYVSPFDIARDIIRAALRILQDTDGEVFGHADTQSDPHTPHSEPGLLMSLIRRFLLGLPIVGAGSVVHMLLSVPLLSPVHFLARYRSNNRRRDSSRDIASLIIIGLVLVGAARFVDAYRSKFDLTSKQSVGQGIRLHTISD
jgi:hypothetical protein